MAEPVPYRNGTELLAAAAFAASMFGLKLALILEYGSATPFWDQWDLEAANLYRPYLEGRLEWLSILAPHNEHRMALTRIVSLSLLEINGLWNPLLQLVVNATLHIVALLAAAAAIACATRRAAFPAALLFCLIVFGIPHSWESTLVATQSCYYLLLLFGVGCLWLVLRQPPLSAGWWAGFGCAVAAFLSLASGSLAFLAAAVVSALRLAVRGPLTARGCAAVALLAAGFVVGHALTPDIPWHRELRAHSLAQAYQAAVAVLSWPLPPGEAFALLRNFPGLVLAFLVLSRRRPDSDSDWFLLGLVAWSTALNLALAYGRAALPLSSRYLDLMAMTVLANAGCALALAPMLAARARLVALPLAWVAVVILALASHGSRQIDGELAHKLETRRLQVVHVRAYLQTGDPAHLRGKPFMAIPYPDPERLAGWLSNPSIRSILPGNLRGGPGGLPERTGLLDKAVLYLLERHRAVLALGAVLGIYALLGITAPPRVTASR